jgi:hypothetical protein
MMGTHRVRAIAERRVKQTLSNITKFYIKEEVLFAEIIASL